MSFVPLPWWTSQSRISTREASWADSARRAATATLLNRQKPIARAASAWCPGGRWIDAANPAEPPSSSVDHPAAPPAECSAASHEPGEQTVSTSSAPPPAQMKRSIESTYAGRVDQCSRSREAAGDSSRTRPSPPRA